MMDSAAIFAAAFDCALAFGNVIFQLQLKKPASRRAVGGNHAKCALKVRSNNQ
jgi:hypothetical protein